MAGSHLISIGVECPSFQTVVGREGEGFDLVLVVTYAETKLPLEIGGINQYGIDADVGTAVGERAFVGPLSFETGDVADGATRQEVVGLGIVDFSTERKAVLEHVERQSHVETIGGFPLNLRVLNVGQLESRCALEELHIVEVSTSGVVVYIVVTGDFETSCKFRVVDGTDLEPIFIGEHPSGLYGGEESPLHTGDFDTAVGLTTKTRRTGGTSAEFEEVAVHVVVINVGIVA